MPTGDKPEALQITGTLMERLGIAVGSPATVYVMGVHTQLLHGGSPLSPYQPGSPWSPMPPAPGMPGSTAAGVPDTWCPPTPGPGPAPGPCPPPLMTGTAVVHGVLAFAGADYADLHVPMTGINYREILIPYNAIGMILPGGRQV